MIKQRNVIVFLLLTIFLGEKSFAQSPFRLHGALEFPIIITAGSLLGGAQIFKQKNKLPSVVFIDSLRAENVNKFDRPVVNYYSKPARMASDVMLYSSFTMPAFLMIDKNIRKDALKVTIMDLEVIALNTLLTDLVKEAVHRPRPFEYNPRVPMSVKRQKLDNFKSFFSGHTSTVSSQSFYFATVYTTYNPHSKWLPLVWATSASFPLAVALCRVKGGKHFWTDVITGYLVGAVVGAGVPALHRAEIWQNVR